MVIAPHPDDEILGCGGTIAKAIKNGREVNVIYLSSGDSIEDTREKEALAVGRFLGLKQQFFFRLKDQTFVVNSENVSKLVKVLQNIKPEYVFVNHSEDSDFEHKIAYQLVCESHWKCNLTLKDGAKIKGLVLYEVHKPLSTYNLVENITPFIDIKMKAMKLYKSQISKSRIDLGMIGLNNFRGTMNEDCGYAEVFQIKKIRSLIINEE